MTTSQILAGADGSAGRPRFPRLSAFGASRWPWVLGCLVSAGWALSFLVLSTLAPQRSWGLTAGVGYLLAASAAVLLPRDRVPRTVSVLALVGAVAVPFGVLIAHGWAQSEVRVVQDSAARLLATGSPYLAHPHGWTGYTPYLPGMTLFGLPHSFLPGVLGDARVWFLLSFLGSLVAAWYLTTHGGSARERLRRVVTREPGAGGSLVVALALITASPLVALPAAVSGVDLPMVGGLVLALALAGRGRGVWAGVVLGLVCALKWTAWPAIPVALLLLWRSHGWRPAARCAAASVVVGGALVAPFAWFDSRAMLEQVVRFPLGLSHVHTPANSPLPGHLLAELGPAGRTASFVLLAVSALALVVWLLLRPPLTTRQACDRLALGVALAFLLAPAGRFGYLELPALLWLWPRLAQLRERLHPAPKA